MSAGGASCAPAVGRGARILIGVLLLAFFAVVAHYRLIGRDEGYYLYAARDAAHGRLPYVDFFYPQMPLLPYLFGAWGLLFGMHWEAMRMLCALAATGTGVLLMLAAGKRAGAVGAAGAALLFAANVFVFPWYPIAENYGLSLVLLFGAWYCVAEKRRLFWGGVLFGLAVAARLPLGAAVLGLLYEACRMPRGQRLRAAMLFLGGAFIPAAAVLALAAADPQAFYFNNLGYHLVRAGDESPWPKRWKVLGVILGLRETVKYESMQFPLLALLAVANAVRSVRMGQGLPGHFIIAALLFVAHFMPDPVYVHYFCCVIPFFILGAVELAAGLIREGDLRRRRGVTACAALLLVGYLLYVPADLRSYLVTGRGVIGIMRPEAAAYWNISAVRRLSAELDRDFSPGTQILTGWTGYLFESKLESLPGAENPFGLGLALDKKLKDDQLRRMHIVTRPELRVLANAGKIPAVLAQGDSPLIDFVSDAPYHLAKTEGKTQLWVADGGGGS